MATNTETTPAFQSKAAAWSRARALRLAAATTGAVALYLAGAGIMGQIASASPAKASAGALLGAGHAGSYSPVLVDSHGHSLYTLTDSAGRMVCTGKCLAFWPPVLVSAATTHVSLGAGVSGEIGFIRLSKTTKEVTFDGYPLYTFVKDTGAGQSHGEGVVAFGGTWELLRPSALVAPPAAAGAKNVTTTTASSGY